MIENNRASSTWPCSVMESTKRKPKGMLTCTDHSIHVSLSKGTKRIVGMSLLLSFLQAIDFGLGVSTSFLDLFLQTSSQSHSMLLVSITQTARRSCSLALCSCGCYCSRSPTDIVECTRSLWHTILLNTHKKPQHTQDSPTQDPTHKIALACKNLVGKHAKLWAEDFTKASAPGLLSPIKNKS